MDKLRRILIPYKLRKKILDIKYSKKINIYKMDNHKVVGDKKVSVIIPNYNYANYIEERIDSVLRQTYPIYELIILDDASTDNSIEMIEKALSKYKLNNIKIIKEYNKKNSGSVFSQWQKGISLSSGDYFWIAEADDSSNPHFLEKAMEGFNNKNVVISYTESARIDENNKIIGPDCRSWMLIASDTKWNNSYTNNGIQEIKDALFACNTIPNVSAVVFKKKNQIELLEDCKKYKISGDWFLYFKLLLDGDISYCSKSLNFFRKHSNSTSTTVKKEYELKELLEIQNEIRKTVELDSEKIHRQSFRYQGIIKEVDDKVVEELKSQMAKKIAWIIPYPIKGSGGIRTMIQNANYLVTQGYEVDLYIEEDFINTDETIKELLIKFYGKCLCNTYIGIELRKEYDLLFATYSVNTPDYVRSMNAPKKAYFIQDFEPWFEPMGGKYLDMERTYKYGFEGISIGNWLANKLKTEFNTSMHSFSFCADLNVYKKLDDIKKENAICFIHQPEKARRCSNMGLDALRLVKKLRPDVKIYLYGSDTGEIEGFTNLGIIKIDECNKLYNKCKVGLCISASNPSRIPFEMMAAGLPVVDLYRENNFYDIPEDGVLLADSTPEGLATALISILDNEKEQEKMSKAGLNYMKDYPLEKGFEQFGKFVNDLLNDNLDKNEKHNRIYNKKIVLPSKEVMDNIDVIKKSPMPRKQTSKYVRYIIRVKKAIKRRYDKVIKFIFRV